MYSVCRILHIAVGSAKKTVVELRSVFRTHAAQNSRPSRDLPCSYEVCGYVSTVRILCAPFGTGALLQVNLYRLCRWLPIELLGCLRQRPTTKG